MRRNILLVLALMVLLIPAHAAFKKISFSGIFTCDTESVKGTLQFIPGAPKGDYSAFIDVDPQYATYVLVDGMSLASGGYTKPFNIPDDEGGLKFNVSASPDAFDELGSNFNTFFIPFTITPGDDMTLFTGFGSATGSLEINDSGCKNNSTNDDNDPKDLADTLVGADNPSFEDVDTDALVGTEVDLKVNFTYKVDKTAYDLFATLNGLSEGDITEKAKELASKFGIKLDIKNLKKLAKKELKQAAKGKKGEAKSAAIEEAKNSGINRLLSEIILKLPPLPPKGSVSEADREARKKIIKAKKAKILEGLEVELISVVDGTQDGKAIKCLSFRITLPAKLCPKDDGSKALLIAGSSFNLMNLEDGESVTIDIPVKVTGVFKKFFGDSGKKGKNGKITIPLTLTNPADETPSLI